MTKSFLLCLLLMLTQCTAESGQTDKYIMHSSGMYMTSADNHTAVLASATPGQHRVKPFSLTRQTDGSHVITLKQEDRPLYLGLGKKDGWSTFFLPEKAGKHTQYIIEETGGRYVKLKNLQTGKYLGTDACDENASVYSDK